tara:strand:+ start:356 stop:1408 length:1053 start_codon:yes stop_codon:yes gene_type:complete
MQNDYFKSRRVVVTGACGTIGTKLIEHLVEHYEVGSLVGMDNNESELFFLDQRYQNRPNLNFFLGDIRDLSKLTGQFAGADVVFHAAAFKHVILCERSPFDAVRTNILAVQNVIDAAIACKVETVIFTSSDKAVNPTSVMGTSKLMGERLITAANSNHHGEGPNFASTRFGNVLGSRGSVIPIFREQIRKGGPITLTDPEMTRFIMSVEEATRLVIDSAQIVCGGEVFVTKMPVVRIRDLAEVMIRDLAPVYGHAPESIAINVVGSKPGEKLYEELMSDEEMRRTIELPEYFAIVPAFRSVYRDIDYVYSDVVSKTVENPYNSANETPMTQPEIRDFLLNNNLMFENAAG